jgi:hypothetical protein
VAATLDRVDDRAYRVQFFRQLTLEALETGSRTPFEPALDVLADVVARREADWQRLLTPVQLRRLSLASGGHLRDLLRLLMDVIRRATRMPVTDAVLDYAIASAQNQAGIVPTTTPSGSPG